MDSLVSNLLDSARHPSQLRLKTIYLPSVLQESTVLIHTMIDEANRQLNGRKLRIVKTWRDQPVGRSKKDLKGTVQTINYVYYHSQEWFFGMIGHSCLISLDYIEFMEE
jgi:hypothetical protein